MKNILISLMFVLSFFVGSCGGDDKGDSCLPEQEGVSVCRDGVILECKLDDYTYKAKWIEQYKCEDKGYYAECDDEGTYCKEEEEKDCLSNADCPSGYYCNLSNGICVWDLTSCKTTADCIRSQYCDLENPQESPITGAVSYFCKDRPRCLKMSDCPMNWRCLIEEGFCITDK
nr:hypothetical protein [bacterium]